MSDCSEGRVMSSGATPSGFTPSGVGLSEVMPLTPFQFQQVLESQKTAFVEGCG